MKKSKKILALVLAAMMIFSMTAVTAFATPTDYLDDAIINQYNSIDKAYLTTEQQASLILDELDAMLAKEAILIELPLIGNIDLTSVDAALDSIYDLTGNLFFGSLTVGDLVVLETYRSDIASARRSTEGKTDMDVITGLVSYLSKCAPTLVKMIDNEEDFSWGLVKGFLPPEFRLITDDFNAWLDELLWDAVHPVNSEAMPSNLTLDDIVQFLCDNQLGAEEGSDRAIAMGFAGVMPGFDVNIAADSGYRILEEGIYRALNAFIVPLLNDDLQEVIKNGVDSNKESGGELYTIVNTEYEIAPYNFDSEKGLMAQINDVFAYIVDEMLQDGVFTWNVTADDDYVGVLTDNLTRLLRLIIQKGGETEDVSDKNLEALGDYFARIAVNEFVSQMNVPATASMEEVAYLGLRELCASVLPEGYTLPMTTGSDADYRAAVIELGADLGAYYLNNSIGLDCDLDSTAAEFLSAFVAWCMDYIGGLFDSAAYDALEEGSDGWDEVDAILWSVIPKEWLPAQQMVGSSDALTFESLLNYILDIIFNFDISKLNTLLTHQTTGPLTGTARSMIVDFVVNILDGAFSSDDNTPCVEADIAIFEDLVSPVGNTTDIICNIFNVLADDTNLQTTVMNMVVMLMGLSDPQSLSDVHMDLDSRIQCGTDGAVSSTMRISNFSSGINSAWRDESGVIHQDQMYKIELVSLTAMNGNTPIASLSAPVTAGTLIDATEYVDVPISGSVTIPTGENDVEVRFDLSYYLLNESGQRIGSVPLVASAYTCIYKDGGSYTGTTSSVSALNVTFEGVDNYLFVTDVYDVALVSVLATNEIGWSNNGAKDIVKSEITGTIPNGIIANVPESGAIVNIDSASIGIDSYGTVNPYVSAIDPDDPQPYGIYPMTIKFVVKKTGSSSSSTTGGMNQTVVIYNDFGLGGLLGDIADDNRQRSDYSSAADTAWLTYLNAVAAGYNLLNGNPDLSRMFANPDAPDGSANAYSAAVDAIQDAVAALDVYAITDTTALSALAATLSAYGSIDREDYVLFTYDRFSDAYDRANSIVNSQNAPDGQEETFVAPALKAFDIAYANQQLTLWGGRRIFKTVDTRYLADEVAKVPTNSALYTATSWAAVQQELTKANNYIAHPENTTQGQVNSTRVNLMEAVIALEPATATTIAYLVPVADSGVIIDQENRTIHGIPNKTPANEWSNYVVVADSTVWEAEPETMVGAIVSGFEIYVYDNYNDDPVATYCVVIE